MQKNQKSIFFLLFELAINGFREIALGFLKILLILTIRFNINLNNQFEKLFSHRMPFKIEIETDEDSDWHLPPVKDNKQIRKTSFQNLVSIQSLFISDLKSLSSTVKSEKLYQLVPHVDSLLSTNIQFHHYMEYLLENDKQGTTSYATQLFSEYPDIIGIFKSYLDQIVGMSKINISDQTIEVLEAPLQIVDLYIKELEIMKTTIDYNETETKTIEKVIQDLESLKEYRKTLRIDTDYSSEGAISD